MSEAGNISAADIIAMAVARRESRERLDSTPNTSAVTAMARRKRVTAGFPGSAWETKVVIWGNGSKTIHEQMGAIQAMRIGDRAKGEGCIPSVTEVLSVHRGEPGCVA